MSSRDTLIRILGIETSCDETAASVVCNQNGILSNLVLSQIKNHEAFGGVVPEIAARAHLDHLDTLIKGAMQDSGLDFSELSGVAATCGPGLIGGVMIGMVAGKAIAASHNLPFLGINHLEGHALTPRLTDKINFPYLLLLISGGHTQILVVEGVGLYKRWGTTLDDAAGECFDKSAKLLGLAHPGGPNLEALAAECEDPEDALKRYPLPTPMKGRQGCDFSFSGLKTAMRVHINSIPEGAIPRSDAANLAAAFQKTMANILADRCANALRDFKRIYQPETPTFVVSGGVAANKSIRQSLLDLCAQHGVNFYAPPLALCSDNAAMIAWAGVERLRLGLTDPLDFPARPRWPLDPDAPARHGAGVKA